MEALGYLWLRPWCLGLLGVAIFAALAGIRSSGRLGAWERAMDPELLDWMRRTGRVTAGGTARNFLPALVLAVLAVALAGPAHERRESNSYRNLDGVVLVLDLSPSVTDSGRLFDVITAARLATEAAGTRQVALVVYAGEAYVAQPFSSDARALSGTLALIDAQSMPVEGSRPATALRLTRENLEAAEILAADVVLLSDGGALGPEAMGEARTLAARGWNVSAIAVPGVAGGSGALDALARAGGGAFATLEDPFPVVSRLSSRPVRRLIDTGFAMLVLKDYGRTVLLLALIPAFLLLPRGRRA
ncbi:MAG: vWA domain-containing protein [Pseudomonadota bacterium]